MEWKPDFEEAQRRWLAFWERDLLDRPLCSMRAPRDGAGRAPGVPYLAGAREEFGPLIEQILAWGAGRWWGGEAMPCYVPSFGPDQMAAWLGCELRFHADEYHTDWAVACIDDWDAFGEIRLDPDNPWWRRMLDWLGALADGLDGKLLLSHLDLHSNLDTLLAMRTGAKLCLDLIDQPETIDRAMRQVRALYAPIYQALYDAAKMDRRGTQGWVPAYHPVRTNTIQCDFCALIGPEHFRRFALPALEEEAAFLGHCVYHLDGPECLVHLDDLLGIDGLDCIQWTTGARNKPMIDWLDLLKRIQARGKAVWVPCNVEDIKIYHRELDPRLVFYDCHAPSQRAGEETLAWLVANT